MRNQSPGLGQLRKKWIRTLLGYVVNGKMIGGFALVAFPDEYGVSGVKTFIVNHQGIVYQKDLGPATATVARQMTRFNPDKTQKRSWLSTSAGVNVYLSSSRVNRER